MLNLNRERARVVREWSAMNNLGHSQRRVVQASQKGLRLDVFVSQAFGISRGKARQWILAGHVALNRRIVRMVSKEVFENAVVECDAPGTDTPLASSTKQQFSTSDLVVLHWDSDWMVINKPPGLPTQPTLDRTRVSAVDLAKEWCALQTGKPAYVALHHRLDRDTSGILVFATGKQANAGLARAFRERLAHKTYLALVRGEPSEKQWPGGEFHVDDYLLVHKLPGKRNLVKSVHVGGDRAITDFRVLKRFGDAALIEARPHTGRMHQIRAHLSEAGFPILGDSVYGGPKTLRGMEFARVQLHAAQLEIPHPMSGVMTTWSAPLPADMQKACGELDTRK